MHVFLTKRLVTFPSSPSFLAAFVKNSPICCVCVCVCFLFFCKRSSIPPDLIVRRSAMVYCQEKRGDRFLYLVRTIAGKVEIITNWTAPGISRVGFWTKSPAVAVSLSAFHTRTCFPLTGSSSTTISPHWSLRHSSLALNPKIFSIS